MRMALATGMMPGFSDVRASLASLLAFVRCSGPGVRWGGSPRVASRWRRSLGRMRTGCLLWSMRALCMVYAVRE